MKRRYLGLLLAALACGGRPQTAKPAPTVPLPTAGLAGQRVSVLPLTLIAAEEELDWTAALADRRAALDKADSTIGALLAARAPELTWVSPDELRRVARRSPGLATDPDQLGTALLRTENLVEVPDPLRHQLRTLMALAGGRFALAPAGLVYRRKAVEPSGRMADTTTAIRPYGHTATAELSVVLVDARLGRVAWRTVARGDGADPWTALTAAVKALTPGLP